MPCQCGSTATVPDETQVTISGCGCEGDGGCSCGSGGSCGTTPASIDIRDDLMLPVLSIPAREPVPAGAGNGHRNGHQNGHRREELALPVLN